MAFLNSANSEKHFKKKKARAHRCTVYWLEKKRTLTLHRTSLDVYKYLQRIVLFTLTRVGKRRSGELTGHHQRTGLVAYPRVGRAGQNTWELPQATGKNGYFRKSWQSINHYMYNLLYAV